MENIKSIKDIDRIVQEIQLIIEKLNKLSEQLRFYKQNFKIEKYIEKENETIEESKINIENILDQTIQLKNRNSFCIKYIEEKIGKLKEIKNMMKEDEKNYNNFNKNLVEILKEKENKIIDNEIKMKEEEQQSEILIYEIEIKKLKEKIETIKREKNIEKNKIEEKRKRINQEKEKMMREIETEEERKRREEEKLKKYMMNSEEIKQVEEWTNKKLGEIIFDSEKSNWNINTSTFDTKLYGKKEFIIVIEDEKRNKFGCYSHEKINKKNERINDSKLFLFSLESNGRYSGMTKIERTNNTYNYGLGIFEKGKEHLMHIGYGPAIYIYKEHYKSESGCYQNNVYFDYKGVKNALCGEESFTPKRFIVIQMN